MKLELCLCSLIYNASFPAIAGMTKISASNTKCNRVSMRRIIYHAMLFYLYSSKQQAANAVSAIPQLVFGSSVASLSRLIPFTFDVNIALLPCLLILALTSLSSSAISIVTPSFSV